MYCTGTRPLELTARLMTCPLRQGMTHRDSLRQPRRQHRSPVAGPSAPDTLIQTMSSIEPPRDEWVITSRSSRDSGSTGGHWRDVNTVRSADCRLPSQFNRRR